jgi:hypothetical protein
MISNYSHTKEWLEQKLKQFPKKDPIIIEKVIKALALLEKLKFHGIDFIFKGGTSLLLLMKEIHRFSIDIDIIIPKSTNINLEKIFNSITDGEVFINWEENIRNNSRNIPKKHFKFYYNSQIDNSRSYILLDILFEENPYIQLLELPIETEFILNEGDPVKVVLPSIDCILGDKLTAYAPNTIGIPRGMGKELEIIKQLFDISKLFDLCSDISIIKRTFNTIAEKEITYKGLKQSPNDVLDEIMGERAIELLEEVKGKNINDKNIIDTSFKSIEEIVDIIISEDKFTILLGPLATLILVILGRK